MKATSFSSSISANLGNSRDPEISACANEQIHKYLRPTGHYKKYSHFKGRDTAPKLPAAGWGAVLDSELICARMNIRNKM